MDEAELMCDDEYLTLFSTSDIFCKFGTMICEK